MAILVDQAQQYPNRRNKMCHMWSDIDDLTELHDFARKCGVKPCWFEISTGISGKFPHYDLNELNRNLAIRNGAKVGSLKDYVTKKLIELGRIKTPST